MIIIVVGFTVPVGQKFGKDSGPHVVGGRCWLMLRWQTGKTVKGDQASVSFRILSRPLWLLHVQPPSQLGGLREVRLLTSWLRAAKGRSQGNQAETIASFMTSPMKSFSITSPRVSKPTQTEGKGTLTPPFP